MDPEPVEISTDGPQFPLGADMATLAAVADYLIPAAHGMPSAAAVVTDSRVHFVLCSRPDLYEPLVAALRNEFGDDPAERLAALAAREPEAEAALQMVIVAAYYTDARVRSLIGYPGQVAKPVNALDYPAYIAEGLLDRVVERGPIWRDPTTGVRARGS